QPYLIFAKEKRVMDKSDSVIDNQTVTSTSENTVFNEKSATEGTTLPNNPVEEDVGDKQSSSNVSSSVSNNNNSNQQSSTSSWLNFGGFSPNLTNQLSNLSSSIMQVTSKVAASTNALVQKTMEHTQIQKQPVDTNKEEHEPSSQLDEQQHEQTDTNSNKDISSFLLDMGKQATSTVLKSAQQLKHVVEEKSLIGNFSKEHEKFLNEKRTIQRREEAAVPPWVGYVEEEDMKAQILSLSQERRNFLRNPPPGAQYHFDMASMYPIALATLDEDVNLKKMRFDLVPKQINEETFWRNYFYRVSLIKQSAQLSALAHETTSNNSSTNSRSSSKERLRRTSESEKLTGNDNSHNQEFVSEDFDSSTVSMDDIRREIEQLTVTKKSPTKTATNKGSSPDLDESEWDKSMADELA
ncbi:unnamed protein product, partial [Didymodactylos carnosus]